MFIGVDWSIYYSTMHITSGGMGARSDPLRLIAPASRARSPTGLRARVLRMAGAAAAARAARHAAAARASAAGRAGAAQVRSEDTEASSELVCAQTQ